MAQLVNGPALAGESQHWYRRDGTPQYTVIGKNGKERPTTLRDAREHNLVPGQTAVIGCAMKWALVDWMVEQGILSALTLPRMPQEPEKAWLARVREDARKQAQQAAATGTIIHAAFEQAARNEPFDPVWEWHIEAMRGAIFVACGQAPGKWSAEKSFAHHSGYGCKLDLVSPEFLVDHKGKDGPLEDVKTWPKAWMQLAAGRRAAGIPRARCFINYFRRDVAEARCVEVTEDELAQGLGMFDGLLAYWKAKNKYESGWTP